MEKNLKTIINENIKPNQVVLVAETIGGGKVNLDVLISPLKTDDETEEKEVKYLAAGLNGAMAIFGDPERLIKMIELGAVVMKQQQDLQEAEKET